MGARPGHSPGVAAQTIPDDVWHVELVTCATVIMSSRESPQTVPSGASAIASAGRLVAGSAADAIRSVRICWPFAVNRATRCCHVGSTKRVLLPTDMADRLELARSGTLPPKCADELAGRSIEDVDYVLARLCNVDEPSIATGKNR